MSLKLFLIRRARNHEIKIGDIIVEFNNKPVGSVDDLHKLLNEGTIGINTEIGVLRGGRKNSDSCYSC